MEDSVVFQWNVSCLNTRFPQNFTTSFELLKEAQHAIVTLHVFCVLPCLKKKRLQCHCENWWSKRAQKTFDLQNGVRNRRLCPIQFLQKWYQMNLLLLFSLHNNPSIPKTGLFWKPELRLSEFERIPKMSIWPPGGWLEALKKLEEQLQILHKVWNDRKSDHGIKKMLLTTLENSKNSEEKKPCKIDGCKKMFSFPTLKFVPFFLWG